MRPEPRSSGCSPPRLPAPSWVASIPIRSLPVQPPNTHNHCAAELGGLLHQVFGLSASAEPIRSYAGPPNLVPGRPASSPASAIHRDPRRPADSTATTDPCSNKIHALAMCLAVLGQAGAHTYTSIVY